MFYYTQSCSIVIRSYHSLHSWRHSKRSTKSIIRHLVRPVCDQHVAHFYVTLTCAVSRLQWTFFCSHCSTQSVWTGGSPFFHWKFFGKCTFLCNRISNFCVTLTRFLLLHIRSYCNFLPGTPIMMRLHCARFGELIISQIRTGVINGNSKLSKVSECI